MLRTNVLWVIYRDDNPKQDLARVVQFAQICLLDFRRKTGLVPSQLGVTSVFPVEAEVQIELTGVLVVRNLPSWAREEVWVGGEVNDAQHQCPKPELGLFHG